MGGWAGSWLLELILVKIVTKGSWGCYSGLYVLVCVCVCHTLCVWPHVCSTQDTYFRPSDAINTPGHLFNLGDICAYLHIRTKRCIYSIQIYVKIKKKIIEILDKIHNLHDITYLVFQNSERNSILPLILSFNSNFDANANVSPQSTRKFSNLCIIFKLSFFSYSGVNRRLFLSS